MYHHVWSKAYEHGNKLFIITRTVAPSNVSKVTTLTRSIFIYPHSPPPTHHHNHLQHSSTLQLVSANYQTSVGNSQEYVFSSQSYVSLNLLSFILLYSLTMKKDAQLFQYFTTQLFWSIVSRILLLAIVYRVWIVQPEESDWSHSNYLNVK